MSAPENPPAFPGDRMEEERLTPDIWSLERRSHPGMSLRDWFAGHALTVVRESYEGWQLKAWFGDRGGLTREEIRAKAAYALADAMLTERTRGGRA